MWMCVFTLSLLSLTPPHTGRQLSIEPLGSVSISDDEAHVDTVRLR